MEPLPLSRRPSAEILIEVPFHDVDAMRVVWHGHYAKYFELARTALTRQLGLDIQDMENRGLLWPIAVCQVKYVRPLRYGQKVKVRAQLDEYQNRLKMSYMITDPTNGEVFSKAFTIQVAVQAETGEMLFELPSGLFPALDEDSSC